MAARGFVIAPNDARFKKALSSVRRVRFANEDERAHVARTVRALTRKALDESLAGSSRCIMQSHLRFWTEFCELGQLNADTCFGDSCAASSAMQLKAEATLLAAFASFVIAFPRGTKNRNTASYVSQIFATVRTFYEDKLGRRPGLMPSGSSHAHLKAAMKGLRTLAPKSKPRRLPIVQYHLHAVKRVLQLRSSQFHRVLWAM